MLLDVNQPGDERARLGSRRPMAKHPQCLQAHPRDASSLDPPPCQQPGCLAFCPGAKAGSALGAAFSEQKARAGWFPTWASFFLSLFLGAPWHCKEHPQRSSRNTFAPEQVLQLHEAVVAPRVVPVSFTCCPPGLKNGWKKPPRLPFCEGLPTRVFHSFFPRLLLHSCPPYLAFS